MLIAKIKKETNIVEYVLYMYQIEDIIRSLNFDLQKIDEHIVQKYDQTPKIKEEIRDWYSSLIKEMQAEEITQKGHLKQLKSNISGLSVLHQTLLTTIQDKAYQKLYENASQALKDLISKSGGRGASNEIEVALNGLYGLLVLRLRKQEVSEATREEMAKVSEMLAHLAHQYQEMKMGKLVLPAEKNN